MGIKQRSQARCRVMPWLITLSLSVVPPGAAQSHAAETGRSHQHVTIPQSLPTPSDNVLSDSAQPMATTYDQYTAFKAALTSATGIQFSMPVSILAQAGTPNGGPSTGEVVYSPTVQWQPFSGTAIGSGAFTFAFQANQFWTKANSDTQQASMGLLVQPSAWGQSTDEYTQITYTHTLPGDWLAVSVGQYSFDLYDGNEYAGNAQANFINYGLAQNGSQTYPNAGLGAFAQVSPTKQIHLAGGFQDATDPLGQTLTAAGLANRRVAWFAAAQWLPPILAGGTYSLLLYNQPAVPSQSSPSQGISWSASQDIDARFGLFLRVNNASGAAIAITTSVAFGGVVNDPLSRNQPDQAGLGFVWSKANHAAAGPTARASERTCEAYYAVAVFKALQVTPDIQMTLNPALVPGTTIAAVFSLRTTFNF